MGDVHCMESVAINIYLGGYKYMSYKFQTGPALMVGKLVQSGTLEIRDDDAGTLRFQIDTDSGAISGSGPSHQVGAVTFGGAVAATGSITAGSSFIIGSADINETDLEKLDGITNGTATAAKAVVLDASKNIATIGTIGCGAITSTGASTYGTLTGGAISGSAIIRLANSLSASGDVAVSGAIHAANFYGDGAGISGLTVSALSGTTAQLTTGVETSGYLKVTGSATFAADVTAGTSFIIGSADLNETDMEKLDGITNGTATAAKAVVLDASKNIATIGTIGCGAITSTGASSFGSISSVAAVTMTGVLSSSAAIQVVGNTILGGNLALSGTFTPTGVADATADLNADSLYFRDNDDSGLMKREEVKDFVDGIAGTVTNTGLAGESDGTMKIDIANMTAATIATTDTFVFNDQNGNVLRQETVDDLFTIGPALTTEAAIAVADDYVLFLDGGATGDAKKEKWADIATAIAGANITATNGVLAASAGGGDTMTVSSSQDADLTLAAGLTWQASASAGDRTWTLPASPDNGDIITVKVGDLNGNKISIARAGSQTIDGANSVDIESNFGAVSLVYVGSDLWKIY